MSAWVIALALSAGYLVQKNFKMNSRLEEAVQEFQEGNRGKEGETAAIRKVQRTVPDSEKFDSMNVQDLTRKEAQELGRARQAARDEVARFESPEPTMPEIQGVYLHFDNRGV